jgi:non-ribosomal peptide synthetase component F
MVEIRYWLSILAHDCLDPRSIVKPMRINAGITRPSTNFVQLVLATASGAGAKPAIVERGREWSYDWFVGRALAFAQTLEAAGVRPGDRVAILLPRGGGVRSGILLPGVPKCWPPCSGQPTRRGPARRAGG